MLTDLVFIPTEYGAVSFGLTNTPARTFEPNGAVAWLSDVVGSRVTEEPADPSVGRIAGFRDRSGEVLGWLETL